MTQKSETEEQVASLIVESLNLEDVNPEEIDPEAPLFGDGLGLDSIDGLEIALALSKKYGVKLRADDPDNVKIFASLRSLAAYVDKNRTS